MTRNAAVVFAAAVLALAGCGDDSSSENEAATGPAKAAKLAITATGDADAPTYEVAGESPAGLTEITFTNNAKGDQADGQLVRVDGEHSDQEVLAMLKKAMGGKPVEDWFQAQAGVGSVRSGATTTVTQVLEPGKYYVLGGDDAPKGPPASFEVTGDGGGELPEVAASIDASEYTFAASGLKAGKQQIRLENAGSNWHHFIGFPIIEGATIEDVKKFAETEKGKPPIDFESPNAISSTVMDAGVSQVVEADLKPGKYAFLCFLADRQGGAPHVARGMISEVEVQ